MHGMRNKKNKFTVEPITIQSTFNCFHELGCFPLALVVKANMQMLENL
jgi:hypothetical protein